MNSEINPTEVNKVKQKSLNHLCIPLHVNVIESF